jgi:nitroreductase
MTCIESIRQRRSVRSYTGKPLSEAHAERIESYIGQLKAPFGVQVSIHLIHTDTLAGNVKLGTYGVIGGAKDFLTLSCEKDKPLADEAAGYVFEQLLLFCTSLGLGTCWLGGSFSRSNFGGQIDLREGERLRIVSPVGYAGEKIRLWETLVNAKKHHTSRKPFASLFFSGKFDTPLTEEAAGTYRQPLEMVRLAPSANNFQPWRVLLSEGVAHFYHRKTLGGFDAVDSGIALCHFGETCRELHLPGHFAPLPTAPHAPNLTYSASWLPA